MFKKFIIPILALSFPIAAIADDLKSRLIIYSSQLGYGFYEFYNPKTELFSIQRCDIDGNKNPKNCGRVGRSLSSFVSSVVWFKASTGAPSYLDEQFKIRLFSGLKGHRQANVIRSVAIDTLFAGMTITGLMKDAARPNPLIPGGVWGRVIFGILATGVAIGVVAESYLLPEVEYSLSNYVHIEKETTQYQSYVRDIMESVEEAIEQAIQKTSSQFDSVSEA